MATIGSSTSNAAQAGNNAAAIVNNSSGSSNTGGSDPTSGIDWNALIEVGVSARLAKATSLDLKITQNEAKLAAYDELKALLGTLTSATQALRAPSGFSNRPLDVFQSRAAYLTGKGVASPESALAVTAEVGADVGSFDVRIRQLAQAHKIASASQPSKSEPLGQAGVFSLGTGGEAMAEITITEDMSLNNIVGAINAEKAKSGVQASVVQVAENEFQLVLSSVQTGQTITGSAVSGTDVLADLGIIAGGAVVNEVQESRQAIITVDGIQITRSSNEISDVMPGVTLHLYQVTPDDPTSVINVEIGTNLNKVKEAVLGFAEAYNAYRDFAYAQQQLPSQKNEETTVLFGDSTLRNIASAIGNAISAQVGSSALGVIGLSLDNTNKLVLDETKLDQALLGDISAIENLLAFKMDSSSNDLQVLQRGKGTPAAATIDVTLDAEGKLTGAAIAGDSSMFEISGNVIKGKKGTEYEGYQFVYSGKASKQIDVSFSAGIAEQLYNISATAASDAEGSIKLVTDSLNEANDDMQAKADDIRSRTEVYRTNLTQRYAKYQAAISAAESSTDYLKNLIDTWNNPS